MWLLLLIYFYRQNQETYNLQLNKFSYWRHQAYEKALESKTMYSNSNLQMRLNKTISSILGGNQTRDIRESELRLAQLSKDPDYILLLCNILAQSCQGSILDQTDVLVNKKIFVCLQIKKHVFQIKDEQCWWLLRQVYYSDTDQIARHIRDVFLKFQGNQTKQDKTSKEMILFNFDPQNSGFAGLVRYLTLVYDFLNLQMERNKGGEILQQYGQNMIQTLLILIESRFQSELINEFALTILLVLKGLVMNSQGWKDKNRWEHALDKLSGISSKTLIKSLSQILRDLILQSQFRSSVLQLISASIWECLQNLQNFVAEKDEPKRFYAQSLLIIDNFLFMKLKIHECMDYPETQHFIGKVVTSYYQHFIEQRQANDQQQILTLKEDDEMSDEQKSINSNKSSILRTAFKTISKDKLKSIISQTGSFQIISMQFYLSIPDFPAEIVTEEQLESILSQLHHALSLETDAYLFAKDKRELIDTLLGFLATYRKNLSNDLRLKACYVLDLLAFKCDCISMKIFQVTGLLIQEMLGCTEPQRMIEFLAQSISHVNENIDWLVSHTCYSHVIKIIINTPSVYILSHSHHSQVMQLIVLEPLEQEIVKMIRNIIQTLKKEMNFASLHQLNDLLQYVTENQNGQSNLVKSLGNNQIAEIVTLNFNYFVYTQSAASLYVYFNQFKGNAQTFIQSLNFYDFWERCESEKLQFYVGIYLRLIDTERKLAAWNAEKNLIQLKKNLWHRFVSEKNPDQRENIVKVFEKHPKNLGSLYLEYERTKERSFNKKPKGKTEYSSSESCWNPKMEIQL